jgi:dynein heavy chain 1
MDDASMKTYLQKWMVFSVVWAFSGDMWMVTRVKYNAELVQILQQHNLEVPATDSETSLLDYEVRIEDMAYHHWRERVPVLDLKPEEVSNPSLVIDTVDTIRHVEVVGSWMEQRKPFILCGPPGSGKTMSLMTVLKNLPECELASLNFSSGTDAVSIDRELLKDAIH